MPETKPKPAAKSKSPEMRSADKIAVGDNVPEGCVTAVARQGGDVVYVAGGDKVRVRATAKVAVTV